MENRDILYFNKLWSETEPKSGLKYKKETWDQMADKWAEIPADEQQQRNKTCKEVTKYFVDRGVLTENSSVIDLGCGFGGYVMEFAKIAKSATCCDISPRMLHYCKKFADELGLKNVDYVDCDFCELDVEKEGWQKKYDLVFTSISPTMSSLDSVYKVNKVSRGWCFNNSFVYKQDKLVNTVMENVFKMPSPVVWNGGTAYCLFNILWQLGYSPEIRYYDENIATEYQLTKELCGRIASTIIRDREPLKEEVQRVYDFLAGRADSEGKIIKTVKSRFAWTLWNVEK